MFNRKTIQKSQGKPEIQEYRQALEDAAAKAISDAKSEKIRRDLRFLLENLTSDILIRHIKTKKEVTATDVYDALRRQHDALGEIVEEKSVEDAYHVDTLDSSFFREFADQPIDLSDLETVERYLGEEGAEGILKEKGTVANFVDAGSSHIVKPASKM